MNTLQQSGFLAEIDIDEEGGVLRGTIVNAREPLEFKGNTVPELKAAFANTVADFQRQSRDLGLDGTPTRSRNVEQHARMVESSSLRGRLRPGGALDYWALQEAYDELVAGLFLAHGKFASAGDNGIEGAKFACQKMAWFINCRWENPELASPFLTLFKALEDVQAGGKPDLFSAQRGAAKRPRTSLGRHFKRFVAALHEADIQLGTSAKQSAKRIAHAANKWPTFKHVRITSHTVKNWRDFERASPEAERVEFKTIVGGILAERDPKTRLESFLTDGPPGVPDPFKARKLENDGGF